MKDQILVLSKQKFFENFRPEWLKEMEDVSKYRAIGPVFPDGTINWQCPCMAGGSLVAHRCGNFFRELYKCMKTSDLSDPMSRCPNQFVDWMACMQKMSVERREQMRKAMLDDNVGIKVDKE